jgi:hypothetical protein
MRVADDVVISPKEVEPESAELNLSEFGLTILGASWGESGIEGTAVRTATGQVMVDRQPKPTTATLTLGVREDADTDLATAAHRLQLAVGSLQRGRRWMRRDFYIGNFAGSLLCQISGEVTLSNIAGWQAGDSPDVTLTLVRNPTWYSTEEDESEEFVEETERELVYELPAGNGTAEGLKRITVTNLGDEDWRALIWAEECRDYQEGPTNKLDYLAADLTPKGGAEIVEFEGLQVVEHDSLTAGWLTILDSQIEGVGHMTHRGTRRLWLRVFDPGVEPDVQLRARWRALGGLRWSEDNAIVPTVVIDGWQYYDMGEARPQLATIGDERWEFQVMARAPGGSGAIRIHKVYPLPTEQYMVLSAPGTAQAADIQLTKSPGKIAENASLPKGIFEELDLQAWSNPSNAKTSNDSRATVALENGGKNYSRTLEFTELGFAIPGDATITGIAVDAEGSKSGSGSARLQLHLLKAGSEVGSEHKSLLPHETDAVLTSGSSTDLWGSTWTPSDINHKEFGVDLFALILFGATTARVDDLRVRVYYTEAADENKVCFAERSVQLRSDGVSRQHPTDEVWGDIVPDGFPPFEVPGGLEERPSRGILIPSQGDLGELPDSGTSPLAAVIGRRDGYHFARGAAT